MRKENPKIGFAFAAREPYFRETSFVLRKSYYSEQLRLSRMNITLFMSKEAENEMLAL